jgi:hypothetical protein
VLVVTKVDLGLRTLLLVVTRSARIVGHVALPFY